MVRFKNRYLTFAVRWGEEGAARLSASKIAQLLRASLTLNFGAHGSGAEERALQVKYYDARTGLGMVRCTREGERRALDVRLQAKKTRFKLKASFSSVG